MNDIPNAPGTSAPPTTTPPHPDVTRLEGEAKLLSEKLAESNGRASTLAQQFAALTTERNNFQAQVAELAPKAAKLAELEGTVVKLEGTVTSLTNEKHERNLVAALRNSGKLPSADDLTLGGVLIKLHETGQINRFAPDTAAEVAKALPIITTAAPSLTRAPTSGGGSAGAPTPTQQTPRYPGSLIRPRQPQ